MSTAVASFKSTHTRIPVDRGGWIDADVALPSDARSIVLFAHGSGSSRLSPRNRHVAAELNLRKIGTVVGDLLTPAEADFDERCGTLRFDIELLTRRLVQLIEWVRSYDLVAALPLGLFGASTGAAAALDAAAARPEIVAAVVSRGGRPDLAMHLDAVAAPTLLIVGGNDTAVLHMNSETLHHLHGRAELRIVPGATHLFEEPGALEAVAAAAGEWFIEYLRRRP